MHHPPSPAQWVYPEGGAPKSQVVCAGGGFAAVPSKQGNTTRIELGSGVEQLNDGCDVDDVDNTDALIDGREGLAISEEAVIMYDKNEEKYKLACNPSNLRKKVSDPGIIDHWEENYNFARYLF